MHMQMYLRKTVWLNVDVFPRMLVYLDVAGCIVNISCHFFVLDLHTLSNVCGWVNVDMCCKVL